MKRHYPSIGLLVFLTVIASGVLAYSFYFSRIVSGRIHAPPQTAVLIGQLPDYENLSLNDLPNFSDYRQLYHYGNNLLVVGYNRIVEFDPQNKRIVRINDARKFGCINETALMGDQLYVSCYAQQRFPQNSSLSYSILYRIDLPSGKLINTYFDTIPPLESPMDAIRDPGREMTKYKGRKINMHLASEGNNLWLSSWDGVMHMDTVTGRRKEYTTEEIFGNVLCKPSGIFNEKGSITVISGGNLGCDGAMSVFDNNTNTWNSNVVTYDEYFQKWKFLTKVPMDGISFPTFYSVSQKIRGVYYLLASDGVYTVHPGSFPGKIIDAKITSWGDMKSYGSADGKYIVFLGAYGRGPSMDIPTVRSLVHAYMIHPETLLLTDLTEPVGFSKQTSDRVDTVLGMLNDAVQEEHDGIMYFKNSKNELLASINLTTASLTIEGL